MKFTLDTTNKTIRLEDTVSIDEFFKLMTKLLPRAEWSEFTVISNTVYITQDPIQIPVLPYNPIQPWQPLTPWYDQPWITITGGDTTNADGSNPKTYSLNSGIYAIDASHDS